MRTSVSWGMSVESEPVELCCGDEGAHEQTSRKANPTINESKKILNDIFVRPNSSLRLGVFAWTLDFHAKTLKRKDLLTRITDLHSPYVQTREKKHDAGEQK